MTNVSCRTVWRKHTPFVVKGVSDLVTVCSQTEGFQDLLLDWDYEKNPAPDNFTFRSNKIVNWKCHVCGNSWTARICNRTCKHGTGCPECVRVKMGVVKKQTLKEFCDSHSEYAYLLDFWDYEKNGSITPGDVLSHSKKEFHWVCRKCGTPMFKSVHSLTSSKVGCGCRVCREKRKCKAVICLETGVVYESVTEAAKAYCSIPDADCDQIHNATQLIGRAARGKMDKAYKVHWMYLSDFTASCETGRMKISITVTDEKLSQEIPVDLMEVAV